MSWRQLMQMGTSIRIPICVNGCSITRPARSISAGRSAPRGNLRVSMTFLFPRFSSRSIRPLSAPPAHRLIPNRRIIATS